MTMVGLDVPTIICQRHVSQVQRSPTFWSLWDGCTPQSSGGALVIPAQGCWDILVNFHRGRTCFMPNMHFCTRFVYCCPYLRSIPSCGRGPPWQHVVGTPVLGNRRGIRIHQDCWAFPFGPERYQLRPFYQDQIDSRAQVPPRIFAACQTCIA